MKIDASSGPYFNNDIQGTQGQSASVVAPLPSLYDKDTPIEALILLLHSLHEQFQATQNSHTQKSMQIFADKLEAQHKKALALIETSIEKQFKLTTNKETAALGNVVKKSLVAIINTMTAVSAVHVGGSFLPIITATAALFTAADAAVSIISYAQIWGSATPEQTLTKKVEGIFAKVLAPYTIVVPPTMVSYLNNISTFLIAATLISTNTLFSTSSLPFMYSTMVNIGYHGHNILQGVESLYDFQVGQTQSQLAKIQAEQKELQTWQNIIKELLNTLQKGVVKQYKLSEEVISSSSDALQQHFSTLQYVNRNIV